ncbi:MAG: hypothetical protein ACOH2V_11930 [Candidatus Saccharimonadaceae bacterium]
MTITKIFIAGITIIVMLLLVECTTNNDILHKQLNDMASNINKSTPVFMDQHTRFDSIGVTKENVFQYYYTIVNIDNPREMLKDQKMNLIENMKEAFATDKSLRVFSENDVTIEYIYRDTTNIIVDIITLTPSIYK